MNFGVLEWRDLNPKSRRGGGYKVIGNRRHILRFEQVKSIRVVREHGEFYYHNWLKGSDRNSY